MSLKLYRSSAGSGKTYTLVTEFLKLALLAPGYEKTYSPKYIRHILAVTFTNAAAQEMRERVICYLKDIAENKPNSLLSEISNNTEDFQCQYKVTKQEVIFRAKKLHEYILHNYAELSIGTIDSFNHNIVQSFKKELGFPYQFDILLEEQVFLKESIEALFTLSEKNVRVKNWIKKYLTFRIDLDSGWVLDHELIDFGKKLIGDQSLEFIDKIKSLSEKDFENIKTETHVYLTKIGAEVKEIAKNFLDLVRISGIDSKDLYYSSKGIYGYFEKHLFLNDSFSTSPNSYVIKTIEEDKWLSSKADEATKQSLENIKLQLVDLYERLQEIKGKNYHSYFEAKHLQKGIFQIGLTKTLLEIFDQLKNEKTFLQISDFNKAIRSVVENNPIPFIYEKLGEKYHHILIDEFQDTSRIQWLNILPLIENSLSKGMDNMLVGDAKQSIYRWRGGDSKIISSLDANIESGQKDETLRERHVFIEEEVACYSLQKNYRSRKRIVEFNNAFFGVVCDQFANIYSQVSFDYTDHEQQTITEGGHISITVLKDASEKEEQNLSLIKDMVTEYLDKGFSYGDIAILCRENRSIPVIAQMCIKEEISVITDESLLISNHSAVIFLINWLKLFELPDDQILRVKLLDFLLQERYGEPEPISGDEYFKALPYIKTDNNAFINFINGEFDLESPNFDTLNALNLYEALERLIEVFKLSEKPKNISYINRLLEEAFRFGENKKSELYSTFLEYWESNKSKISVDLVSEGNAITITSIHKAKGKSYPVVILPFANWKMTPKTQEKKWFYRKNRENFLPELDVILLPVVKDLDQTEYREEYIKEKESSFLEALNLLYVAFTRSIYSLSVITEEAKFKQPSEINTIAELINFVAPSLYVDKKIDFDSFYKIEPYELEHKEVEEAKKKELSKIQYQEELFYSDNLSQVSFSREKSISDMDHFLLSSEKLSPQLKGKILHYAMEMILYAEDIPTIVRKMLAKDIIDPSEENFLIDKLSSIINLPQLAPFFEYSDDKVVLNEYEISYNDGEDQQILRPDRLVIENNEVTIIEYKTGATNLELHKAQVILYRKALQEAGYQVKKGLVVYIENESIFEV